MKDDELNTLSGIFRFRFSCGRRNNSRKVRLHGYCASILWYTLRLIIHELEKFFHAQKTYTVIHENYTFSWELKLDFFKQFDYTVPQASSVLKSNRVLINLL